MSIYQETKIKNLEYELNAWREWAAEHFAKDENKNTGIKDSEGHYIYLGDKLKYTKSEFLTYEVRVRYGRFIAHGGGCYIALEDIAPKVVLAPPDTSLGFGADLFKSGMIL